MAFNPLTVILKENKLFGPNCIDRKRNLDIVLTAKEYKYVLIEHQFVHFAYDIMHNLKKMFGDQNHAIRQTAMNELEILGAEINGETKVDIVLQLLHDSFKQFFLNYNMNMLSYSLAELLKKHQATEGLIRKPTITRD
ncbi:uncharacterized protein LOC131147979 [Malania oleifera]|uniref:uncharacterized protein LOC131147979 n=1 Tax=Malania oleifera TaxID=397392 RepID=UPI0025AE6D79|nr:uncharacterized protein LOC131147979 [Malania oleifera]